MSTDLFAARAQQRVYAYDEHVDALAQSDNQNIGLDNVLSGAQANAPYLARLLEKWPEIADALTHKTPEDIFQELLNNTTAQDLIGLNVVLRQTKQKVHLLAAFCDLAGIWNWDTVCQCLSDFADKAMAELMRAVAADMGFVGEDDNPVPGLFVLAMGKYGARELNYSSDIDLIVF